MEEWLIFFGPVIFLALPVAVYLLRIRPRVGREQIATVIIGIIAAVVSMLPLIWMVSWFMLYIWAVLVLILLIVHAIVWITAAVKKRESCVGGAVLTGVTLFVSSACLGNWLAVIMALLYLVALFRSRFSF
jgi:hypothetical protein